MSIAPAAGAQHVSAAGTLQNRAKLASLIERHGVTGTAQTLGCSPSTIRKRARTLGIPPLPPGPRRGRTQLAAVPDQPDPVAAIRARLTVDRRRRNFAPHLLALRVRAVHDAELARETFAREDALLDLASVALLLRERSMRLRGARAA